MRYFTIAILAALFFVCAPLTAQNKNVARKHFQDGEYEKAKPMFEKLLKRNPKNSELNYWYAVCCYETGDTAVDVREMLEFAASYKISNAYRYLGDYYMGYSRYDRAIENYEQFVDVTTNDSLMVLYRKKLTDVSRLYRMIKATEKVCVVDSFVVDKEKFLSAYKMGRDVGRLLSVAEYFGEEDEDGGYLAETEMGTDIYYAMKNTAAGDTLLRLYHSSKIGDEWTRPSKLNGIETGGNENFPFMLADGQTLYFASDGEGSIGGYDIFITRYDLESRRYLRPDNLGMPFNSQANDYMMAFNEVENLGWFASDRRQPEGKVCVYVFVPNSSKSTYDIEKLGYDKVLSLASLSSIAATQSDAEAVRKAARQLTKIAYEQSEVSKENEFFFVIDDARDYTALSDFKNAQARSLFQKWQKAETLQKRNIELLQQKRDAYASSSGAQKVSLSSEILRLEEQVEKDAESLTRMEYEIRRLEIENFYKK